MAEEYSRDELVQVLKNRGPQLLQEFFEPHKDIEYLIRQSVGSNTFRGFPNMSKRPSDVFRAWAKSRLTFSVMQELGEIADQDAFDVFVSTHLEHLSRYWQREGGQALRFGPGRKLINLLFKYVVRCEEIKDKNRERLIPLLHVPFDQFSLAAVRHCAASGEFGSPITIPTNATMGWVTSLELYSQLQRVMQGIATVAKVPTICIDLLAWDDAHSG